MRAGTPDANGFEPRESIGKQGIAACWALADGRQLWRFDAVDGSVVARLLRLGEQGVGGFKEGGKDESGLWLVRSAKEPTLKQALNEEFPVARALALAREIALLLVVCETESLFPGPLSPRELRFDVGAEIELRADPLVNTLVGATGSATLSRMSVSPRYLPPEQAAGRPWDNAANRYVFGLILYRLLAGEHAFAGRGLRLGMEEQARQAPAPMPDAVVRRLPPGLQSFCLRLLDADEKRRPKSAMECADRLQRFDGKDGGGARKAADGLRGPNATVVMPLGDEPMARALPSRRTTESGEPRGRRLARLGVLAAVLGGASLAAFAFRGKAGAARTAKSELIRSPLKVGSTLAKNCASCHPRQAGEWHRSIMAHSVKSPLFQALEMVIEEQAGRSRDCPNGAGILRRADSTTACRDPQSGQISDGRRRRALVR